jgi:putative Holliday junction resolvase
VEYMPDISPKNSRRLIGLDIGTHRIGVAVSDDLHMIASPETTIGVPQTPGGRAHAIAEIAALVQRVGARRVVAGLPRNMKGERGVQAEWTEEFVATLRAALNPEGVYVVLFDERLTSAQAGRSFRAGDRSFDQAASSADWRRQSHDTQRANDRFSHRKPTRKEGRQTVDARAATLILQGYLDLRRGRDGIDDTGRES